MTITCNHCKHSFEPQLHEISTAAFGGDGGLRIDFQCPGCGKVYPVAIFTALGVQIRKDIQKMRDSFKGITASIEKTDEEIGKLVEELDTLRERLKGETLQT